MIGKARTLKIEEDGDRWKGRIKPKIRLSGNWLERAGFKPGNRVAVMPISEGVIELRSENSDDPAEPDNPS
jgi:cell division inhibitor SulA